MTPTLILRDEAIRQRAIDRIKALKIDVDEPWAVFIAPHKKLRSKEQSSKMWAMLGDVARQKQWPVNGVMTWLIDEDWKNIFTAALRKENRMALGLDGGLVLLGRGTSKMSPSEMSDLIELMFAFGAEKGVKWTDNE